MSDRHITRLVRQIILIAVTVLFYYADNALALDESTENRELKHEVETLKEQVRELESAQPSVPAQHHKVKAKKGAGTLWHSLKVNMTKAEVTALLGKPGKIDKWKTGEAWYYPNPRGGEIDFDANGNVSGWLEP